MKILLIKLSALGDVIQTLPSLTLIKENYPQSIVDWVVDERNAEVLTGHPYLRKVVIFSKEIFKNPAKFVSFIRRLREQKYDLAIDYQGLFKSGMVIGLAKAKLKVGFENHRELSPLFYNVRLTAYDPEIHAVRRYLNLTFQAVRLLDPDFSSDIETIPEVVWPSLSPPQNLIEKPYIVFIPSARWETKWWIFDYWERLIELTLSTYPGLRIYITGGPKEETLKNWAKMIENKGEAVKSLVGTLSLKELVRLIKESQLVVTVDTGPMHLASALKIPTVALFGPTSPLRTGPWGGRFKVLKSPLDCSPCFKKKCRHWDCMKAILPEQVFQTMKEFLG
ncbi:glycosyltransferase family 9 protein [Thermodesulfobacterium sp. TA1]|uniref:glycosyltransferase family 9 protein n=1 Tax=Thermodesulfobacterium sp. TA1 TaxID=2234087 RepID=UPI0012325E0A|nr:glycosyltransferase family 9 protein [Thermodesulfobacterium sp. TA1]QER41785.1 glycosyltransferase family 9 protein [Thermodesulfobacterium sp. TA1]